MANREPIQYVEIDVDYCTRTYGVAPCLASLGTTGQRKCFNTYATCQSKPQFVKGVKTLRFINNRSNLPKDLNAYPVLEERGVSTFSSSVNIAGGDPRMSAFGRRATVSVDLTDFVDDDIGFDKYVNERISGAAQVGGVGYRPIEFGTFFTRLKARWPFYAGRPLRVVDGYVDGGVITNTQVRNFIITDIKGPNDNGRVTIEAQDVLALADDKKALAPRPSRGKLGADIGSGLPASFSLTPAGIGAEYPASGFATIGSEVVSYTRVGDTITLTGRALSGSVGGSKSQGDSFQEAIRYTSARVDDVIYDLLVNYAKVNPSFCPLVAEWRPEITKWVSSLRLDTVITKPTGVAQLIGELADLGISIWWDDVNQRIKLRANRPATEDQVTPLSDRNNIKAITQEDRDEDRITQVHFYSKQTDPTKDVKDKNNYDQVNVLIDADAESTNAYNDTKVREIFCRWVNNGADSVIRTLGLRLLKRFNTPPVHYVITLDTQDRALNLADVIQVDSRVITDDAGLPIQKLLQVFRREETRSGHEIRVSAQAFNYDGKYGVVRFNGDPVYSLASAEQKRKGTWLVNGSTLVFSDGADPYTLI